MTIKNEGLLFKFSVTKIATTTTKIKKIFISIIRQDGIFDTNF